MKKVIFYNEKRSEGFVGWFKISEVAYFFGINILLFWDEFLVVTKDFQDKYLSAGGERNSEVPEIRWSRDMINLEENLPQKSDLENVFVPYEEVMIFLYCKRIEIQNLPIILESKDEI